MWIDTHAHLDFPDFSGDLAEVLARANHARIRQIVTIGTDGESSNRAVALAEAHPSIFAAVGWHPGHVDSAPSDVTDRLLPWMSHPKVVALGECGLDYYRLPTSRGGTADEDRREKDLQARVFVQQLELAVRSRVNLVIHTRHSFDDTLQLFRPYADRVRAVFHCFIGTSEQMRKVIELGSLVSFTGIATFKSASDVRETIQATPEGCFFLETDSPFLAPIPHRGRRCEPAFVSAVADCIAQVRGVSLEELAERTTATAMKFFRGLEGKPS